MDPVIVGAIGIIFLLFLLAFSVPIGVAMTLVGFLGFAYLTSWGGAINMMSLVPYAKAASYTLSVVPLFILMGHFGFHSGLSSDIYNTGYHWLGRMRGGLAMATIAGCAGFAAICGASPATAATMGTVCIPEMEKYKYDPSLATGSVAAGGTLGILIPPSLGFVIYGIISENSIISLFIAGIIPGIVLSLLFMVAIYIVVSRKPELAPEGPSFTWKERLLSLRSIWTVAALFIFVIGGMFTGLFSPTEAAAIGAFGTLLIMAFRRKFTWENFFNSLLATGKTTGMVFLILIGAFVFGYFIAVSRIPAALTTFVSDLPFHPTLILIGILGVYVLLGCIMDAIAMVSLTVPVFYPVVIGLGFDPIWFGVIVVAVMEMALITPPVGMNVYVLAGVAKDVPIEKIFKGVFPFVFAIVAFVILLFIFPSMALWLPGVMR
jgi:C4-dicarboxylate transporter, DctM subunit